jgi:hypothetical protein
MFGFGSKEEKNTSNNDELTMNKVYSIIDSLTPINVKLADGYGGYLCGRGRCGQGTNWYIRLKDGDLGIDKIILPSKEFGVFWFHPDPLAMALGRGEIQVCITSQGDIVPWGTNGLGTPYMMTLSGMLGASKDEAKDWMNKALEVINRTAQGEDNRNKLSKEMGITKTITEKEGEENKDKRK